MQAGEKTYSKKRPNIQLASFSSYGSLSALLFYPMKGLKSFRRAVEERDLTLLSGTMCHPHSPVTRRAEKHIYLYPYTKYMITYKYTYKKYRIINIFTKNISYVKIETVTQVGHHTLYLLFQFVWTLVQTEVSASVYLFYFNNWVCREVFNNWVKNFTKMVDDNQGELDEEAVTNFRRQKKDTWNWWPSILGRWRFSKKRSWRQSARLAKAWGLCMSKTVGKRLSSWSKICQQHVGVKMEGQNSRWKWCTRVSKRFPKLRGAARRTSILASVGDVGWWSNEEVRCCHISSRCNRRESSTEKYPTWINMTSAETAPERRWSIPGTRVNKLETKS